MQSFDTQSTINLLFSKAVDRSGDFTFRRAELCSRERVQRDPQSTSGNSRREGRVELAAKSAARKTFDQLFMPTPVVGSLSNDTWGMRMYCRAINKQWRPRRSSSGAIGTDRLSKDPRANITCLPAVGIRRKDITAGTAR